MQRCVPRVHALDIGSVPNEAMLEVRLCWHPVWFRFEVLGIEPKVCACQAPPLSYAASLNWNLIGSVWVMRAPPSGLCLLQGCPSSLLSSVLLCFTMKQPSTKALTRSSHLETESPRVNANKFPLVIVTQSVTFCYRKKALRYYACDVINKYSQMMIGMYLAPQ